MLRLLLWMRERSEHGADFLSRYQLQLAGLFGRSHLKTLLESRGDTDGKGGMGSLGINADPF